MFEINDIVVNKKGQVCRISDIIKDYDFGLGKNTYYILVPCFTTNASEKFYIPVDKEGSLRPAINKEEIYQVIHELPTIEVMWITNPKIRKTTFKEMYDSGKAIEKFKLIKSFEHKKIELLKEKKTLSFTDENFLKEIKRNLYNEFAIVLGIDSDEVEDFIEKEINKNKNKSASD